METRQTVLPLTDKGAPLAAGLAVRTSQTMPGRLKVTFLLPTEHGLRFRLPDGTTQQADLDIEAAAVAVCPEFRLEMG